MENEELAALRATLLAAQRQPLAVKVAQARLSALLANGDELLPYMLVEHTEHDRNAVGRLIAGPMEPGEIGNGIVRVVAMDVHRR